MDRPRLLAATFCLLAVTLGAGPLPADAPPAIDGDRGLARRFRRPVAMAAVDGGRTLLVANRESGSISRVDLASRRVTGETPVGRQLADLAVTPDGRWVLVTDRAAGELILLDYHDGRLTLRQRVKVAATGGLGSLSIGPRGRLAFVASEWSRTLTPVELSSRPLAPGQPLRLGFAPGRQIWLPDGRTLLVADVFGGRLAVIDVAGRRVRHVHELLAHNIRGLALSADRRHLLLTHQVLNSAARSTRNDVFWGLLMSNNIRRLPLTAVLSSRRLTGRVGTLAALGQASLAAGDPAGLAVRHDDSFVVALAGVHQLGLGRHDRFELTRVSTGRGPTRVWLAPDRRHAVVTVTYDDRLSIIDLDAATPVAEISLGPTPEPTEYERGERLFFDATLSLDGWMSCHSCHTNGHTNGLLADTLGDGSYGTPKRVISLLGTIDTAPWAWDGRRNSIRGQVLHSISNTMRGTPPTPRQARDLSSFVLGLRRPAPGFVPGQANGRQTVARGERLFQTLRCVRCHPSPLFTSPDSYDVGLSDESGRRRFNPPSLRGIGQRRRLFHDNRAGSIEEVLGRFQHQLPRPLSGDERKDLARFLKSL